MDRSKIRRFWAFAQNDGASEGTLPYTAEDDSSLADSGQWTGQPCVEAQQKMAAFARENGFGTATVTYRLKDWGVSRQRYWGTPIPMVYCANGHAGIGAGRSGPAARERASGAASRAGGDHAAGVARRWGASRSSSTPPARSAVARRGARRHYGHLRRFELVLLPLHRREECPPFCLSGNSDPHGHSVRRNVRVRLPRLEAGLLSGWVARGQVPGALRRATQLGGDQLHLSSHTVVFNARVMGEGDATGLRLRDQGAPAHHPRPSPQRCCRSGQKAFSRPSTRCTRPGKLGPVLFQLPPYLKLDLDRLAAFLPLLPRDRRHAFEFRDPSWLTEDMYALLREHGVALCVAESERLEIRRSSPPTSSTSACASPTTRRTTWPRSRPAPGTS